MHVPLCVSGVRRTPTGWGQGWVLVQLRVSRFTALTPNCAPAPAGGSLCVRGREGKVSWRTWSRPGAKVMDLDRFDVRPPSWGGVGLAACWRPPLTELFFPRRRRGCRAKWSGEGRAFPASPG